MLAIQEKSNLKKSKTHVEYIVDDIIVSKKHIYTKIIDSDEQKNLSFFAIHLSVTFSGSDLNLIQEAAYGRYMYYSNTVEPR